MKQRARGPRIWQFRWRDKTGKRLSEDIGTEVEYRNRSAVEKCSKVAYLRIKINDESKSIPVEKFGVVLERYVREEMPKRFSTGHSYLSYINNHIRPKWGEYSLAEVKPLAVRDWLRGVKDKKGKHPLASKTRGHIKGLMHRIFDCAMLWEYLPPDRNPMSLVRIEGTTKRRKKPRILTPKEFGELMAEVNREPCRTMVILALCTGVRCSELVALKWRDIDWQNLSIQVRRAMVAGRLDDVKTEYSDAPVPLDPALAEVMLNWKRKTEFHSDSDFVFASPFMAGEKPYTPWNMQHNHLRPAAVRAGLGPIGWHTLRHTYRAWLGDNGEPLTVQKELMRHASIQTTLNTYGGGMMESMREAHGRVVKQAITL
ncbi:MAG TPA: site-specific integrase [Candidatus Sulfotelmatobacter sp.]|nr:site-specific integrase [Candidatus Sulfotelmatobacter sp.]